VAGVVVIVAALGGGMGPGIFKTSALAQQQGPQLGPNAPAAPGNPQGPGGPGYGPGGPGYGPRFGPGYGPRFGPERFPGGGGRGFGRRAGIVQGWFALNALLRFALLIALLVIAWKVITSRLLWGRPDGAVQIVREQLARGDITEEEYRKRLAALS
jgi:uncharacterized membrane protein